LSKVDLVELVSRATSSFTEVPVDHIASAVQPALEGTFDECGVPEVPCRAPQLLRASRPAQTPFSMTELPG